MGELGIVAAAVYSHLRREATNEPTDRPGRLGASSEAVRLWPGRADDGAKRPALRQ